MPKFNLYRIDNAKREDMLRGFEQKKLIKVYDQEVHGFQVSFFVSQEQEEQKIWWVDTYSEFIPTEKRTGLKNQSHFAALVAHDENNCYVISLGRTFFYMRDYCLPDFGIDVAERIANMKQIDIKNSRHFAGVKIKTIDTYKNAPLDCDIGEAVFFLKAKTINPEKWGKTIRCGTSVQFQIDSTPVNFIKLLHDVTQLLKEEPRTVLPRATPVRNQDKIDNLYAILLEALTDYEVDELDEAAISMSELSLFGTEFVFWGNHKISLKHPHSRDTGELQEGNEILDILSFIRQIGQPLNLDTLQRLKIVFHSDTDKPINYNAGKVIEFLTHDKDGYYFLSEGRWLLFSQKYVDSLRASVDKIEWEADIEGFTNTQVQQFKKQNPDKSVNYREYAFNNDRSSRLGYHLGDREQPSWDGMKIEIHDLIKDGTAWAVKIGKTRSFAVAIDQSLASLKYVQEHGKMYNGQAIENFGLWLLTDNKTPISKLSDLKSLIFLIRLHEWQRQVRLAGFQPRLRIGTFN